MASLIIQDSFEPYYDGRETAAKDDMADDAEPSGPVQELPTPRTPRNPRWQRLDPGASRRTPSRPLPA